MDEIKIFNIKETKLVIGLGNIGKAYDRTRHNIGFDFIDKLCGGTKFNEEKKLKALLKIEDTDYGKIIFVKPTTMMNSSGEAVSNILNYYKLNPSQILVIHDDLDLRIGSYKIQFNKGPKVHNGIISIENRLGTSKFWRLRVGIDNRTIAMKKQGIASDYVLSGFKPDEIVILDDVYNKFLHEITSLD